MAEIKWIKITTDMFDDEKIKVIDTLPDRDAVLVVWLKLLALAGKKNEGGLLFMSPKVPFTVEMLAAIFNRPVNTIRFALETFKNFGMIEIEDNEGATDQQEYCVTIEDFAGIKGDPNCDNTVDILDALMAINLILDIIIPSPEQSWAADCNGPQGNCDGDGSVDVLDVLKIVNVILGLDECP